MAIPFPGPTFSMFSFSACAVATPLLKKLKMGTHGTGRPVPNAITALFSPVIERTDWHDSSLKRSPEERLEMLYCRLSVCSANVPSWKLIVLHFY
jgi:hypothetical protein